MTIRQVPVSVMSVRQRSARGLRRLAALLAVLLALPAAGCMMGDGFVTGATVQDQALAKAVGARPSLLVATTRKAVSGGAAAPFFNAERGRGLTVAEAQIAGPDTSLLGKVSSVVTGDWAVTGLDKVQRGSEATKAFADAAFGRDVLLYVHGYRESFESAAASAAQLADGVKFRGRGALFSWPSAGGTLDYGYDRESALWSRDAFEDLLASLLQSPSGGRVFVVAHSMGTLLTLEALRNLRSRVGDTGMAKLGGIVLASPDVDIDLFTRGVERLGADAQKITVISSTSDRALALSSRIAGGVIRAGAADRGRLEALGVRVADATDYGGGLINHDLFLSNPEVLGVVKRAVERAGGGA